MSLLVEGLGRDGNGTSSVSASTSIIMVVVDDDGPEPPTRMGCGVDLISTNAPLAIPPP